MMLSPRIKKQTNMQIDTAVRDGIVLMSQPWIITVSGCVLGAISGAILSIPFLINAQQPWTLLTLSSICGIGYSLLRKTDLTHNPIAPRCWFRIARYHYLASFLGWLSFGLIIRQPFWILLAGPLLALTWQSIHDRLLLFLSRPQWDALVVTTARLYFSRSLALPSSAFKTIRAQKEGLLEITANIDPRYVDSLQQLGTQLPGIQKVDLRDLSGASIISPKEADYLNKAVAAARAVAEIKQERTAMFASPDYEPRRVVIHDYSGRALVTAVVIIIIFIGVAVAWMNKKEGFKRITAQEIQWFFGKYGVDPTGTERRSIPKSLRPRNW